MLLKPKRFPHGGIHPHDSKELSRAKAIQTLPVPAEVVIPMSMHTGKPANCVVAVGAEVAEGQKIGEMNGAVSANIHSSVAGVVKSIETKMMGGRPVVAVTITAKPDAEVPQFRKNTEEPDWETLPKDEIINRIMEAGIVGMGGAMFPTHVKLNPPPNLKIEKLIINAVECEPYLTCDERIMLECAKAAVTGIRILSKVLGVEETIVGIEENKPEAIKVMADAVKDYPHINIQPLKTRYPQGGEKQLISAITGREVPSGGLPAHVGVVVSNIHTSLAVKEAVCDKKPLIDRVVTITGNAVKNPGNFLVRIGTPLKAIVEAAGGFAEEPAKIIAGGPMMGQAIADLNAPVTKGTSGIVVLGKKDMPPVPRDRWINCIRCGKCVEVCPARLMPALLGQLGEERKWSDMKRADVYDCMECGCCSFVCPSNRPLVHWMRLGKIKARMEEAK